MHFRISLKNSERCASIEIPDFPHVSDLRKDQSDAERLGTLQPPDEPSLECSRYQKLDMPYEGSERETEENRRFCASIIGSAILENLPESGGWQVRESDGDSNFEGTLSVGINKVWSRRESRNRIEISAGMLVTESHSENPYREDNTYGLSVQDGSQLAPVIRIATAMMRRWVTERQVIQPRPAVRSLRKRWTAFPENGKPNIFISYRRSGGAESARLIKEKLAHACNLFLDVDSLGVGNWQEQLTWALRETDILIAVISSGSVRSQLPIPIDYMRWELRHAQANRTGIIPFVCSAGEEDFLETQSVGQWDPFSGLANFEAIRFSSENYASALARLYSLTSVKGPEGKGEGNIDYSGSISKLVELQLRQIAAAREPFRSPSSVDVDRAASTRMIDGLNRIESLLDRFLERISSPTLTNSRQDNERIRFWVITVVILGCLATLGATVLLIHFVRI